jgi:hypothetical protein
VRALFLTLLLVGASAVAAERSTQTEAEINFLLTHVHTSELIFIRNGKDHDADEAHEHMMAKYQHFDRKIDSAEAFIELSATRSLLSGRPYRIRLPNGEEMEAGPYLLGRLAEFRASHGADHP